MHPNAMGGDTVDPGRGESVAPAGPRDGSRHLPVRLTSFIGREAEGSEIVTLLERERLITLVGAGGCGKTRLAQEVARDREDEAVWVDLSTLAEEDLVVAAIASALEQKEVPGRSLLESVKDALEGRPVLLLLDNCEHVVATCARAADELLRSCPNLTILATSREPLGVEGEVAWRVPSLDPASARRLFADRATQVRPGFELAGAADDAVVEICRRLDGMPLAIELAAARVRMMTPEQIADGLEDRFRLLTSSARTPVPRHRALRASVDWSHDLLSDEERLVLRRLAVFAGGFTLDAAETVCSDDVVDRGQVLDLLSRLVDRSLVQVEGEGRYRLLETIRTYALDRLIRAGELDASQDRHLVHFLAMAERAATGMESAAALDWLPILERDHDEFRAAFDRAERSNEGDACLRLVGGLWMFWFLRGHLTEGRRRAEIALRFDDAEPSLRVRALVGVGQLETYHGDLPATARFAEEAARIARRIGDERWEGRALSTGAYAVAFLDPEAAPAMFDRSVELLEGAGDAFFLADALNGIGIAAFLAGDLPGAAETFERGVGTAREGGNLNARTIGLGVLGYVRALQGRLDEAEANLTESLGLARRLRDDVFTGQGLFGLGLIAALRGRQKEARPLLDESVETVGEASPLMLTFALVTRAFAGWLRSDLTGSAADARQALALAREMGMPWPAALSLAILSNDALAGGDPGAARTHLDGAPDVRSDLILDARGRLARAEGDSALAESLHHEALAAASASGSILLVPSQLEAIGGLASLGESHAEAARLFGAAEAARAAYGFSRPPGDGSDYEADFARTREALADGFDAAWQEGAAMPLEEAVAYASRGRGARKRPATGWASLTPTELEVVRRVAEGLTNPQIAERLFVSRSTVKVHVRHVFAKLGVSTRAELAALAAKREL